MSYMIVCRGICVENQVQPSMVQRALKWWSEWGMSGKYTAVEEPPRPKTEITLARKTNSK